MNGFSTKLPSERRTDNARREAFDQRDRSKQAGFIEVNERKSGAKMAALDQPIKRWI